MRKLFVNGKIRTIDKDNHLVTAFAVEDGKFIAVGTEEEVRKAAGNCETIDLQGRDVLPGFVDAHLHFLDHAIYELFTADLYDTKSPDELVDVMKKYLEDPAAVRRGYLHMLLHCLYLHIFMEPDRDSGEWDRECDCFVEQLIDKAVGEGKISLKKRKSDDTQVNTNTFDDHIFWQRTAGQASGGRRTKEKWEHILAYTSQNKTGMQSRAGTQTNDQQEELDEIYRSKYDYRKFLKQFCRLREEVELDTESFDYIFYSFGMEHYGNIPLIEPLEYKEVNRLEELVIAIDTSGSCSGETVQRFLGETYGILSEKENFFSRMKVYIVQCDCFIQKVDVIHSEEEWKEYIRNVKIQGRGGTDFRPVFELIRQEKERKELKNLRALIYFTDGDGIYPGQKPDYETAFVFLKRTDKMKLVPPWAKCLITGMGQTAEQMSV